MPYLEAYEKHIHKLGGSPCAQFFWSLTDGTQLKYCFPKLLKVSSFLPHPFQCGYGAWYNIVRLICHRLHSIFCPIS